MSYNPPSSRTAYGDTDFIREDDWNPEASPRSISAVPPPTANSPYGQSPAAPRAFNQPPGMTPGASSQTLPNALELAKSITPEDMLFMRQWDRDSFLYRVFPITTAGYGALFYYCRSKNLPHKISRYAAVSVAGFFIGRWLYKDEFIRRLSEHKSNSPYMEALRKAAGLPSAPVSAMDVGMSGGFGYSNAALPSSPYQYDAPLTAGYNTGSDPSRQYYGSEAPPPFGGGDPSSSSGKQQVSYDELRARNRGLIR